MPRLWKTAIVVALLSVVPYARAGAILEATQTPLEVSALRLNDDGQWMLGRDWGFDTLSVWMSERWQGGLGTYVAHANEITLDPARGEPTPTTIMFEKEVVNETAVTWRAFQILLSPGDNSQISNVSAMVVDNTQYNQVSVVQFMNGTYSLVWNDPDGGIDNGVSPLEMGLFNFTFDITGDIQFRLTQRYYTGPIPEPMSVSLLAMGALLVLKRRR